MNKGNLKHNKLGIACVHLTRNFAKEKLYEVIEETDDEFGNTYLCKKCSDRFEEITKNGEIDDFITICEHCLKEVLLVE